MTRIPILKHPVPGSPAEELLRRMLAAEPTGACRPAIALSETADSFHLRIALPGVDARSVRIGAVDKTLVLQAECCRDLPGTARLDEFPGKTMFRRIEVPEQISPDTVTALLDHGMLQITATKASAIRNRVMTAAG